MARRDKEQQADNEELLEDDAERIREIEKAEAAGDITEEQRKEMLKVVNNRPSNTTRVDKHYFEYHTD